MMGDDGLWRDPTPMPDGSLIVAHAAGPIDLDDPAAAPAPRLMHITLAEDRATNRPSVASITAQLLLGDTRLPKPAFERCSWGSSIISIAISRWKGGTTKRSSKVASAESL